MQTHKRVSYFRNTVGQKQKHTHTKERKIVDESAIPPVELNQQQQKKGAT
jgi:hypothetical protein